MSPQPEVNLKAASKGYASGVRGPLGCPADYLNNQFVYLTISPRAGGLSVGINLNPDTKCNFQCRYCDVDRSQGPLNKSFDCAVASRELEETLNLVHHGGLRDHPSYDRLPRDLLSLKHVALSGDGEPTASPYFNEAVATVTHLRASGLLPFFKIVLITNAAYLDQDHIQGTVGLLTSQDEIWAKLDAGTQEYMNLVNSPNVTLEKVLQNILLTARKRAVIIQSLFSSINGCAPDPSEILEYAHRLRELKKAGANISMVQIYSARRAAVGDQNQHLPLKILSSIAGTVRAIAELPAEVY